MNLLGKSKAARHRSSPGSGKAIASVGLLCLVLAGCGARGPHHVTVGAVPEDYRTRHPIIISEQEATLDIPVASGDRRLTVGTREIIRGFAREYRRSASGTMRIMVPSGSMNAGAASHIAQDVRRELANEDVPASLIIETPYQVLSPQDAAPIRLSYLATAAHVQECGRWGEDLITNTSENRNYENFGCATQNNLAAQLANPTDLLAPRGMSPIDAARRQTVIGGYQTNGSIPTAQ